MLELDRLLLRRDGFEVDIAGLRAAPAQCVNVIGPSGSGKSSLLRAIVGLEPAARVEGLRWRQVDLSHEPPHRRPFGWLPQELGLWPSLNAAEHVAFARTRGRQRKPTAEDLQLLEQVSLSHRTQAYPATLSGGERQRLAFARVLAARADWALLDEPFSHLDPVIAHDLAQAFATLARREGIGMIRVTHQWHAPAHHEAYWVIEEGRLTQSGCWSDLVSAPATPWIARFVSLVH